MTRSLALVNLSNWDHEDYVVYEFDHTGQQVETRIRPGEAVYLRNVYGLGESKNLTFMAVEDEQTVPFEIDGQQRYPEMVVARPDRRVLGFGGGGLIDFSKVRIGDVIEAVFNYAASAWMGRAFVDARVSGGGEVTLVRERGDTLTLPHDHSGSGVATAGPDI